jgi:hypothetical protein
MRNLKPIILVISAAICFLSCVRNNSNDPYQIINKELVNFLDNDKKVLLYNDSGAIKFDFPQDECPISIIMNSENEDLEKKNMEIEISNIISSREIKNLCEQLSSRLVLNSHKLAKGIKLIDKKYLTEQEYKGLFTSYQVISNPAFTADGRYAIVYSATHCGIECGGGGLVFLKKTNGKWEKIAYIMLWVS